MDINPGGVLPPEQVIGRDTLIERYWNILQGRSIALVAPRRVGKSSILTRMQAHPPQGIRLILLNVEGRPSLGEFVRMLYQACHMSSPRTWLMEAANAAIQRIGGKVETSWFKLQLEPSEWHRILDAVFDDLQGCATAANERVVVAWDEFTWYLHDLDNLGQGRDAGLLLDRLRAIRQSRSHDRIRMCFTGSIGLEEVLDRLQQGRHIREPMNDVDRQVVPVLDATGAETLARRLVQVGAGKDLPDVALALAQAGEGHPYFIQHLAQALKYGGDWSVPAVAKALNELIGADQDPLELVAFVERIALYRAAQKTSIEAVLDRLSESPCTVDELLGATKLDRSALMDILRFLRRDLYVTQEEGKYRFHLDIVRRFWRRDRGLS